MLRTGALGGAALASLRALGQPATASAASAVTSRQSGGAAGRAADGTGQPAALTATLEAAAGPARSYAFNQYWLFGGVYVSGSEQPGYDDSGFAQVTLPHTVTPLSWGNWDYAAWENVWIYREALRPVRRRRRPRVG